MKQKKTININTLNGYFNYGNRLQLFALSRILSRCDYNIFTYWPRSKKELLKALLKYYTPVALFYRKEMKLKKFTRKYLPKHKQKSADISIYGSDQIWNPRFVEKRPYLLGDVSAGFKISYAASMGVENINKNQSEMFRDRLSSFNAISVREQSVKQILQPLINKEIEVVLDPTLLLHRKEYEELEQKPKNIDKNEKYALCYILGNHEQQSVIEKYAKERDLKVILFSDKRDSDYGVEEFLYLIHHAELICTDSFHACVFSFIFERPFVAFRRTGEANYMYTRLQNLIDTFKLKNREFDGKEITEENLEVDYIEAKKILKKEQEKSLNFLRRALETK